MISLSVVIPCFNEEKTLKNCVDKVLELQSDQLLLQIIIVDDASIDKSFHVASGIKSVHSCVEVYFHDKNKGKGAALRTGFAKAKGDFIVVQDADLEYNPLEIKRLLQPLIEDQADVVYGSRFLTSGPHRVMYYWHSLGNRFLTELSNMFTDLNLTDMETCYKLFKKEIIKDIAIQEERFGFEPEITAKIAQKRCRIYEMGISYAGRTYDEGKKIGWKDGLRAIYCIFKYNAHVAPLPIQLLIYVFIGGMSALVNLLFFLGMIHNGAPVHLAAPVSFGLAAIFNYFLSTSILFRRNVKYGKVSEMLIYGVLVLIIAAFDLYITQFALMIGFSASLAKVQATLGVFILNFLARKYIVFPEKQTGGWQGQLVKKSSTSTGKNN
ncbi:MAG: glycosyltransferase [Candidatus Cyclobacteriaceae bacterium M3_2C_046]